MSRELGGFKDPGRLYVLVALGWPTRGRAGYRDVGTARCHARAAARTVAAVLEATIGNAFAAGPVRPMLPRVAGTRLLAEALAADGRRGGGPRREPADTARRA